MTEVYDVADRKDTRQLAEFLSKEGQFLMPMLDLITQAEMAVDELIDVAGRATIEAVLTLSAQEVAGAKHPGKASGEVRWHGTQDGVVPLAERKVRVRKPRLRRKGQATDAEIPVPAYEAMQSSSRLGRRMLEILMRGVSTRNYKEVLPEMAQTVGVSKSTVSRQFIEASEEALAALAQRDFSDKDILIVYLDGMVFGGHHVISAIGVDSDGYKHVLGMVSGASENATACKALLEDLVARGVKSGRRRLFVIDGSKALRSAIDAVYGTDNPVQRCRSHKIRNVLDNVPKHLRGQIKTVMRAAYRLDPAEGKARLEQQASWFETEYPAAAGSLREGLDETFTANAIGLPGALRRCLVTTNLIESPNAGVRRRTGRVTRWRNGQMALRWVATAMLDTEKRFRRIMGYRHLWILQSYLDSDEGATDVDTDTKAA